MISTMPALGRRIEISPCVLLGALLVVVAASCLAPEARAQVCNNQWLPCGLLPGFDGTAQDVEAITAWDPDGTGPAFPRLVVGGSFFRAGGLPAVRIAAWDGSAWHPFGTGLNGTVVALTTWDADGDGPGAPRLVAGGSFFAAGSVTINRVAIWDGAAWQPLGSGISGAGVYALTTWDPDGPGPGAPQLIAGGRFDRAGGVDCGSVARWDGLAWHPMGPELTSGGSNGTVNALAVHDGEVVAGGQFSHAGALAVNGIARSDGNAWRGLGAGMSGPVRALTRWDPDGEGPGAPVLVAGGSFSSAGGVAVNRVAAWDSSAWQPVGAGMNNEVVGLTTWDPDGEGPTASLLIAGGIFTIAGGTEAKSVAGWDGSAWLAFDTGMTGWEGAVTDVSAVTAWDADGAGPGAPRLVAGGGFTYASGATVNRIAHWDGGAWKPFGMGLDEEVNALTTWDPDGDGPEIAQIVAGGEFTSAGGVALNYIARWDGAAWRPLGTGMSGVFCRVFALTVWDPDGDGPDLPRLVAGGIFEEAGGVRVNNIALWDGAAWEPLGIGIGDVYSTVNALMSWDPDGAGPAPPLLVAAGSFPIAGNVVANHIASWDGTQWRGFGAGMWADKGTAYVHAVTAWDPDGAGPFGPQVIAGGYFDTAGGNPATNIARLDEDSVWRPLGEGTATDPYALTTWDADSDGPGASQLIMGTGSGTGQIKRWDGLAWQTIGSVANIITAMTTWDIDGQGPAGPQLIATLAGSPAAYAMRFDGTAWRQMGTGMNTMLTSVTTWHADGDSAGIAEVVAGGEFTIAAGTASASVARWGRPEPASIVQHPARAATCPAGSASLRVVGTGTVLKYRWQRETSAGTFVDLIDGPTAGWDGGGPGVGALVYGSSTDTLTIAANTGQGRLSDAHAVRYRCAISNACGIVSSEPAGLGVCAADYNCDGFVDGIDYDTFNNDFESTDPNQQLNADINNDGFVDGIDYDLFNNLFELGC